MLFPYPKDRPWYWRRPPQWDEDTRAVAGSSHAGYCTIRTTAGLCANLRVGHWHPRGTPDSPNPHPGLPVQQRSLGGTGTGRSAHPPGSRGRGTGTAPPRRGTTYVIEDVVDRLGRERFQDGFTAGARPSRWFPAIGFQPQLPILSGGLRDAISFQHIRYHRCGRTHPRADVRLRLPPIAVRGLTNPRSAANADACLRGRNTGVGRLRQGTSRSAERAFINARTTDGGSAHSPAGCIGGLLFSGRHRRFVPAVAVAPPISSRIRATPHPIAGWFPSLSHSPRRSRSPH